MSALIITEAGTRLSYAGEHWVLQRDGSTVLRAQAIDITTIALHGGIEITAAAIREALSRKVEVSFFAADGRYRGRLQGLWHGNADLRIRQILDWTQDPAKSLSIARRMISAKIHNTRILLLRLQRRAGHGDYASAIAQIAALQPLVAGADSTDSLMGYEGTVSRLWFGCWNALLAASPFEWKARKRRPPPDPPNALLGFLSALLTSEVTRAVMLTGLDPMVGVLHAIDYGRPSLVLDLMEPWRPLLVEGLALSLMRTQSLGLHDFEDVSLDLSEEVLAGGDPLPVARAVHLSATGRRVVIASFQRRLIELLYVPCEGRRFAIRDALLLEVRALAREVMGDLEIYVPYKAR